MKGLRRILKNRKGQTATEYMLIIAVVVLGAVAAASILLPKFRQASETVSEQVKSTMEGSAGTSGGTIDTNVNQ
jgi:Flp pilus assembly pilin Flp